MKYMKYGKARLYPYIFKFSKMPATIKFPRKLMNLPDKFQHGNILLNHSLFSKKGSYNPRHPNLFSTKDHLFFENQRKNKYHIHKHPKEVSPLFAHL